MTVGRVSDFVFLRAGGVRVKGHVRSVGKATGGLVNPPKAGARAPRADSAIKAQKYAETMAVKPSRGARIGAKLAIAKPARGPAPSSLTAGPLQSATTPMIPPQDAAPLAGMAKGGRLTARSRNALPKSDFGLPGSRKYPMPDKAHAGNAKARASQAVNSGRMSKATAEKIDAKADRILGEKD